MVCSAHIIFFRVGSHCAGEALHSNGDKGGRELLKQLEKKEFRMLALSTSVLKVWSLWVKTGMDDELLLPVARASTLF